MSGRGSGLLGSIDRCAGEAPQICGVVHCAGCAVRTSGSPDAGEESNPLRSRSRQVGQALFPHVFLPVTPIGDDWHDVAFEIIDRGDSRENDEAIDRFLTTRRSSLVPGVRARIGLRSRFALPAAAP